MSHFIQRSRPRSLSPPRHIRYRHTYNSVGFKNHANRHISPPPRQLNLKHPVNGFHSCSLSPQRHSLTATIFRGHYQSSRQFSLNKERKVLIITPLQKDEEARLRAHFKETKKENISPQFTFINERKCNKSAMKKHNDAYAIVVKSAHINTSFMNQFANLKFIIRANNRRHNIDLNAASKQGVEVITILNTQSSPKPKKNQQRRKYRKKRIPRALKLAVWFKYIGPTEGIGKCYSCKHALILQSNFQCGHIVAESKGGATTLSNLRPVCPACNQDMRTKNMVDWMEEFGFDLDNGEVDNSRGKAPAEDLRFSLEEINNIKTNKSTSTKITTNIPVDPLIPRRFSSSPSDTNDTTS